MSLESREGREERETARMEAFSDGVFAFAITLLVLYLRDPVHDGLSLFEGLRSDWASFFALVTSFVTVLIIVDEPSQHVQLHPANGSPIHAVERFPAALRRPDTVHDIVGRRPPR